MTTFNYAYALGQLVGAIKELETVSSRGVSPAIVEAHIARLAALAHQLGAESAAASDAAGVRLADIWNKAGVTK